MKNYGKKITIALVSLALSFALVVGCFEIVGMLGGPDVTAEVLASGADSGSDSGSGGYSGGSSSGSGSQTYVKPKASLSVKGKTVKVSGKKLLKKNQTVARKKILTVNNAGGKTTYKIKSVSKSKFKKYFKINKKNGKLTVKKGLGKGTYKLKINVKTTGSSSCKAGNKTVLVKVKVTKSGAESTETAEPAATETAPATEAAPAADQTGGTAAQ